MFTFEKWYTVSAVRSDGRAALKSRIRQILVELYSFGKSVGKPVYPACCRVLMTVGAGPAGGLRSQG